MARKKKDLKISGCQADSRRYVRTFNPFSKRRAWNSALKEGVRRRIADVLFYISGALHVSGIRYRAGLTEYVRQILSLYKQMPPAHAADKGASCADHRRSAGASRQRTLN